MSQVLLAVLAALIVNELTDVSPWLAIRMARWAAKHIYIANTDRAARRTEEWEALVNKSIPTNISKLFFGLGLGWAGLYCIGIRRLPTAAAALWKRIRPRFLSADTITGGIGLVGGLVIWNLPGMDGLIALGALIGLAVCLPGLNRVYAQVKRATARRRLSKATR